ncbi:putative restriction endonuclease [Thermocatellispora tengchongensis]|uniref:Putative restriction endonuclease n=1 Tax=Thermocatellispora tengchongensis TaxID=1073253 RepID=A0A840NU59_9ACTN|nr:HNH endonuclease [Thermocatellispora tengchongensis]MBB5130792.1 putative restriction endonuclease [Thermocatellispora tengchongensis]
MALSDLDRKMVLEAIEEYDQLGRDAFLERYGYREARDYFVVHNGRRYDSKAIAGVAHRGVSGRPLRPSEFSGGAATVGRILGHLGFLVTRQRDASPAEVFLEKIRNLDTAVSNGRSKRHQPLTLLWALGRAARREKRLAPWDVSHTEISALIREFGLDGDRPNPEYPVLKLTHFELWTLPEHREPPRPSGSALLGWMRRNQPISGLREWVYDLVAENEAVRCQAIAYLLSTYFQDKDQNALLTRVGLGDVDNEPPPLPQHVRTPDRRPTTVRRIIRDNALSRLIKTLHDYTCQVCGTRLLLPQGKYAEGAHIRPLGSPHDGHDVAGNLLCLCPNDHVLFDQGAIIIKNDLTVIDRLTGAPRGTLRIIAGHDIDPQYLAYHRDMYRGAASLSPVL